MLLFSAIYLLVPKNNDKIRLLPSLWRKDVVSNQPFYYPCD